MGVWAVIAIAVVVLVGGGVFVALKGSRGGRQPGGGEALASPRSGATRNDSAPAPPAGGTPSAGDAGRPGAAVSFEDPAPERAVPRPKAPEPVEPPLRQDVNRPIEVEAREQPKQPQTAEPKPKAQAQGESQPKAKSQPGSSTKAQLKSEPAPSTKAQPKTPVTPKSQAAERPASVSPPSDQRPQVTDRQEPAAARTENDVAADTEPGRPLTKDGRPESGTDASVDRPATVTSGLFDADPNWHQPEDEWETDEAAEAERIQIVLEREKLERVVQSASSRAEALAPSVTARNRPIDASS